MSLGAETLAPDVRRVGERRGGVAAHGAELDREIGALVLEQKRSVLRRRAAVGDRRQRLDLDLDQAERVLGNGRGLGEHDRDGLAHVAHLGLCDHRLSERLEIRQRLQPHGDARHAVADILGRDHAVYARQRARGRDGDRADAAMGDGAAQDRRVQHVLAREIVNVLSAPAQKAQILEPFDRAADERVDRSHAQSPLRSRPFG